MAPASFEEKSSKDATNKGFEAYADTVRVAEGKFGHAGVAMEDDEKKEKFFSYLNPRSANWNSPKSFWQQTNTL